MSRTFPSDATRTVFASRISSAAGINRRAAAASFALSQDFSCPGSSLIIVVNQSKIWSDIYPVVNADHFAVNPARMRESGTVTWSDWYNLAVSCVVRRCRVGKRGVYGAGFGGAVGRGGREEDVA